MNGTRRSVEIGVAVVEDPAVGGYKPVTPVVTGGRHTNDGLVEVHGSGIPVVTRVARVAHVARGVDLVIADRSRPVEIDRNTVTTTAVKRHYCGAIAKCTGIEVDLHLARHCRCQDHSVDAIARAVSPRNDDIIIGPDARETQITG